MWMCYHLLIIILAITARRRFNKVYLYLQIKDSFLALKLKKYHGTSPGVVQQTAFFKEWKGRHHKYTTALYSGKRRFLFDLWPSLPLFMTNCWNLTFDIQISLTSNLTSPTHDKMVTTPWDRTEGSRLEMSRGIQYLLLPSLHGRIFPIELWIESKTASYKMLDTLFPKDFRLKRTKNTSWRDSAAAQKWLPGERQDS